MSTGRPIRCRRGSWRNCSGMRCARRLGGAHAEPAEGNPALLLKSFEARQQNFQKALHVLAGGQGRFLARSWNQAKPSQAKKSTRQRRSQTVARLLTCLSARPGEQTPGRSGRRDHPVCPSRIDICPVSPGTGVGSPPWRARGRSPASPKPLQRGWPDQRPPASTGSRTAQATYSPF
jgi:hypothetical protein